ncbi:MAG: DUF899 domain-containing protein [Capsulimonadales bacterium]|nr:DUF899 domain-containing protein [Capsulimonadales bacterium]
MTEENIAHPPVADPEEWRAARLELLAEEKELTRRRDAVNARRRRLPMTPVVKPYRFDGPGGKTGLLDLFEGKRQLIVYHFMFDPEWEKGCGGCPGFVDALGDLSLLGERDTRFVLISRAPLPKLEAYKAARGWDRPWYSSFGSDFNYDFHVTLDPSVAPVEYNFKPVTEPGADSGGPRGESHGLSVFFRLGDRVFHTYSVYARGVETLSDAYALLDVTPYGRQEDFEDSPVGWPQRPTYG